MKRVLLSLYLFSVFLWACSGDCLSCHPTLNLESDVRHKSMATCITCHSAESLSQSNMGAACGQDCFACHEAGKITQSGIKEHGVINECIACHSTLNKGLPAMNWQENLGIQKPFMIP